MIADGTSSGSDLKMRPSRRNEAPMVVRVVGSSKLALYNLGEGIEECEEQVGDNLLVI